MSLLALTSPPDSKPDFRHPHDFSSANPVRSFKSSAGEMTSNPHRDLPPPAAISLPGPPLRSSAPPPQASYSSSSSSTALPAAPASWHGADDSMRVWLNAKMEDDRRGQEEARLGQEQCKLEQRRLEERMLRDALQSTVPPQLIPMIFAGLGNGPLAGSALDLAQQYLARLQQQAAAPYPAPPPPPPPPQTSPDMRQDPRIAPKQLQHQQQQQYLAPQPQPPSQSSSSVHQPSQQLPPQAQPGSAYPPAGYPSPQARNKPLYGPPIQQYAPHSASARGSAQSALPRLATSDPPPPPSSGYSQTQQHEQNSPSPNIYFHHWQPPAPNAKEMKDAGKPPTNPPWRVSGQDFAGSPRGSKRKAAATHEQRAPPPTSNPAAAITTSPTYSQGSSASGKSHRRQTSRDSIIGQRKAYDVIERRNPRETREPSSRDNSTSGRSRRSIPSAEPASRNETPREREEERFIEPEDPSG